MTKAQQRAQWAKKINAAWGKSVAGILECARHLRDAQKRLGPGEFKKLVEHELVISERTVERFLNIADDRRLPTHVSVLPSSWGTLHALTRVPDAAFAEAIANGRINREMTRSEARELVPTVRYQPQDEPQKLVPVHVIREPDTAPMQVPYVRETEQPAATRHQSLVGPAGPEKQLYRPDQAPPSEPVHQRERDIADELVELAKLIDSYDVDVLALLVRDQPEWLQSARSVARFMERLERALGGSVLH